MLYFYDNMFSICVYIYIFCHISSTNHSQSVLPLCYKQVTSWYIIETVILFLNYIFQYVDRNALPQNYLTWRSLWLRDFFFNICTHAWFITHCYHSVIILKNSHLNIIIIVWILANTTTNGWTVLIFFYLRLFIYAKNRLYQAKVTYVISCNCL